MLILILLLLKYFTVSVDIVEPSTSNDILATPQLQTVAMLQPVTSNSTNSNKDNGK